MFPGLVQFRNYRLTNSDEYLKFSALFFLFIIDNIIQSLDKPPFVFEVISTLAFSMVNYIIILIASGAANNNLMIKENIWKAGVVIAYLTSSFIEILVYQNRLDMEYRNVHVILLDSMTFFAGIMLIYAFITTPYLIHGSRTNQTRGIWILLGSLLLSIGFIRVWNNLESVIKLLSSYKTAIPQILDSTDFVDYVTILIGLLTIVLALFYPETMLLSQTQIMKVAKLFNSTESKFLYDIGKLPITIGNKEALKRYIQEVGEVISRINEDVK
ncbi:MAG: hypothetical protein HeimC2_35730 [Candidatus Heimdallarchaeota archaeon LC_2]|nr:MAG: hypothetical protein HeimC2_35730 [Candidatus Heimdallarchaeota archaeon LC_2]